MKNAAARTRRRAPGLSFPAMGLVRSVVPRSSSRTRLFLAALVWTAVGTGLAAAGVRWTLGGSAAAAVAIFAGAALVGLAKGRFLLAPRAARNAERIVEAGDGRCVGGTFSWSTWLLVAGFVVLGAVLRRSSLPRPILGFVYAAVGFALLLGAARGWKAWSQIRTAERRGPRGALDGGDGPPSPPDEKGRYA